MSFAVTLWLWKHWSFVDQPPWLSGVLLSNSFLLVFILWDSVRYAVKRRSLKKLLTRWPFLLGMLLVAICTCVLAYDTFFWLKAYFLPVQMTFMGINGFLFAKRRGWILKSSTEVGDQ